MTKVPPRLHVIPATGCDFALVLRRGPADVVASLLWDRKSGAVLLGQWLRGRIYEHRADISPDGRHMVYFAGTGKKWWTALSRAPYLTALAFWPQNSTWHGGGAFDAKGHVWLNGADVSDAALPDGLRAAYPTAYPHATDGFFMGDMYTQAMEARGWEHLSGAGYDVVLTKPISSHRHLELRFKLSQKNRSIISNSYSVMDQQTNIRKEHPAWEWADTFGPEVQFAQQGALYAKNAENEEDADARLIHDFTAMTFEALKAPYTGVRTQYDPT